MYTCRWTQCVLVHPLLFKLFQFLVGNFYLYFFFPRNKFGSTETLLLALFSIKILRYINLWARREVFLVSENRKHWSSISFSIPSPVAMVLLTFISFIEKRNWRHETLNDLGYLIQSESWIGSALYEESLETRTC